MVRITLKLNKSVEQNATEYFEKSKKAKRKLDGIRTTIARFEKRYEEVVKKQEIALKKQEEKKKIVRKNFWFEKFRWLFTSEGFLAIGGRDATTNEIIVKKHMDKDDVVFHTDMAGSPFFVIKKKERLPGKEDIKEIGQQSLDEVAQAVAVYSRAWKLGVASIEVFHVKPEQVSKEANTGEFVGKGSFIIRGKTTYLRPEMEMAIGILEYEDTKLAMGGSVTAVKNLCEKSVVLQPGKDKPGGLAKIISKKIGVSDLDDIIKVVPAGGARMKK